ncbi:MAG: sialidase family protein [Opitutales bacterium]
MTKDKKIIIVAEEACGWPNLTTIPGGEALSVYFNRASHGLEEGDLSCAASADGGQTWELRGTPAPHPTGGNRMHLAVGLAGNDDLLVFSSGFSLQTEEFTGFGGQWLSRLSSSGRSWEVDDAPKVPEHCLGAIPFGRILKLSDERLAYSCYRSEGRGNPSKSWIVFSEDDGATWSSYAQFGEDDSNEATLLEVEPGRLLAAVRTHLDHHVKLCESRDGGASWSDVGPLTLPMQHPADLIRLGEGLILLTYGMRNRGLMGVGARLSQDGGATWRAPWVLHQFGDEATDCGYPSTVLLDEEGTLLTATYTDFESSLGEAAEGYRTISFKWSLEDYLDEKTLRSISDGKLLKI